MKIFLSGLVFLFFFIMAHYLVWFGRRNLEPSAEGAFVIGMGVIIGVVVSTCFYKTYE
jgi:hypothetical protein